MINLLEIIQEHAYRKVNLKMRVQNIGDQIAIHVLKLLLIKNSTSREHWKSEMWGFISSVSGKLLKSGKKLPSYKFYFKNLYEPLFEYGTIEEVNSILALFDHEYHIELTEEEKIKTVNKLKNFYNKLCILLSSNKFITRDTIYNLIDSELI